MDQDCGGASGAPGGSVVQVCFPSVRAAVLDSLNRQREEGRLCDLSIQVQGQVFRAHRCVLAASSPYFHDQVLLKNVTTVSLPAVMDPLAFESVLSSAYTGQLSIVRDDIVNYVTVASFLQMWHIVDKCTEILKRPRAPGAGSGGGGNPQNAPSRQQSPSSTDCLYSERERERGDRPRGAELKAERDLRERGRSALPPPQTRGLLPGMSSVRCPPSPPGGGLSSSPGGGDPALHPRLHLCQLFHLQGLPSPWPTPSWTLMLEERATIQAVRRCGMGTMLATPTGWAWTMMGVWLGPEGAGTSLVRLPG
ncbi:hypothetical protein AGOR_G00044090 [Albula goreensis]|uniref:BTB domain-containing protein n=1 Tax=Albula goreensis TaxID=1534307 RepID=A0A8T3DZJ9_9TELE|nr:hypothetical protein AGOR_G00044090 [Albula goreensis]